MTFDPSKQYEPLELSLLRCFCRRSPSKTPSVRIFIKFSLRKILSRPARLHALTHYAHARDPSSRDLARNFLSTAARIRACALCACVLCDPDQTAAKIFYRFFVCFLAHICERVRAHMRNIFIIIYVCLFYALLSYTRYFYFYLEFFLLFMRLFHATVGVFLVHIIYRFWRRFRVCRGVNKRRH